MESNTEIMESVMETEPVNIPDSIMESCPLVDMKTSVHVMESNMKTSVHIMKAIQKAQKQVLKLRIIMIGKCSWNFALHCNHMKNLRRKLGVSNHAPYK